MNRLHIKKFAFNSCTSILLALLVIQIVFPTRVFAISEAKPIQEKPEDKPQYQPPDQFIGEPLVDPITAPNDEPQVLPDPIIVPDTTTPLIVTETPSSIFPNNQTPQSQQPKTPKKVPGTEPNEQVTEKRIQQPETTLPINEPNQQPIQPPLEKPLFREKIRTPQPLRQTMQDAGTFVQYRQQVINQSPLLPDEAKQTLVDRFASDQIWLDDKQAELEAATSVEDRRAIKQEITDWVAERKQEHREDIIQNIQLPEPPSFERLRNLTTHYTAISSTLESHTGDPEDLANSIIKLNDAIGAAETAHTAMIEDRTIEHIKAFKDAMSALQSTHMELRNLVQTILAEATN